MLIILYFLFMKFAMPTLSLYAREVFVDVLSIIIFISGMCMLLRAIGICVGKGLGSAIIKILSKVVEYMLHQMSNIVKWFISNIRRLLSWVFRASRSYFSSQGMQTWQCNLLAMIVTILTLLIII